MALEFETVTWTPDNPLMIESVPRAPGQTDEEYRDAARDHAGAIREILDSEQVLGRVTVAYIRDAMTAEQIEKSRTAFYARGLSFGKLPDTDEVLENFHL